MQLLLLLLLFLFCSRLLPCIDGIDRSQKQQINQSMLLKWQEMDEGPEIKDVVELKSMEVSLPTVCSRKPPKHKGIIFHFREKHVRGLSASASVHDFRSLETEEEESGHKEELPTSSGVVEEPAAAAAGECSDSKASTSCAPSLQLALRGSTDSLMIPCGSTAPLWHGFFRLWRYQSVRRLASFPPFGFGKRPRRRRRRGDGAMDDNSTKPCWRNFTIDELQKATDNFSPERLIGKGGSAEIYRGTLENGEEVAVKKIIRGTPEERSKNLLSELGVLGHVDHPNTARLVGVGVEGGMHIVLVLSRHGSLDNFLYGSKEKLNWEKRYRIAVGTARGLEYLHERCHHRIIHRDIKASNVLLTEDFEPQICDFGLAKWLPDEVTHHTLADFEGTFGYLAPEYCMHGIVDEKTDVFAYGVILLELITGRRAIDKTQSLLMWAKPFLEHGKVMDLLDPSLVASCDYKQLNCAVKAAHTCTQHSPVLRPPMSQVLKLLTGTGDASGREENTRTPSLRMRRTYSEEIFEFEEYDTSNVDLNHLSRHRQLVFDL